MIYTLIFITCFQLGLTVAQIRVSSGSQDQGLDSLINSFKTVTRMSTLVQNRMAKKSARGNASRAKGRAGSKRACAQRAGKAAHQAKRTQGNPRKRVLHSCIAGCLSLQMQFCVMFAGHERVFIFIFINIIRYSSNIVLLFAVKFSTNHWFLILFIFFFQLHRCIHGNE